MHTVVALFDAPIPARGALGALSAAGFPPAGMALASVADLDGEPIAAAALERLPTQPHALTARLTDLDVPPGAAQGYADAVRRGAILLVATVPTLSVAAAQAAVDGFGALDLAAHQARIEADPALRYAWGEHEPPRFIPADPHRAIDAAG